jgi:DNA-binding NarL/FixJ family response regulator
MTRSVPRLAGDAPALVEDDRRLLQLVADGWHGAALADATGMPAPALRRRLADIRRSLDARTDVQAVVRALRQGLIE